MKLSISLSAEDIAFVDEYARRRGAPSRSAVLQKAVDLLRVSQLGDAYEEAWREWAADGDAWDATVADGLER